MYQQPGPYPSPLGMPGPGPVPPLPGPRPQVVLNVRWVQFVAAGIVAIQGILALIAANVGSTVNNGPYLTSASVGALISLVIQVGLIITVAIQSNNGINAWRLVGTICASITVVSSLVALTGSSPFLWGYAPFRNNDAWGYAVTQMILSGLLAAAAITALVMWWTKESNQWFDGWSRVRRYAAATGVPVPPVN